MNQHQSHEGIRIQITSDGSPTVFNPSLNETYHSRHGALQESEHVYINQGLDYMLNARQELDSIQVLEIGFGTGLNVFLTALYALKSKKKIHLTSIEPYPLSAEIISNIDYYLAFEPEAKVLWDAIHAATWEETVAILPNFTLLKMQTALLEAKYNTHFHLVYYDAFAPTKQPELWTTENFAFLAKSLHDNACLVTYCAQGQFRRNLEAAGYEVSRIAGPKYKKEMVRAHVA